MTTPRNATPRPYTVDYFGTILSQWAAWKNGHSPTTKPKGYSGQNPHLIAAFHALDRAQARAEAYWQKNPPKR